jgi:transposase, IS30 family
MKKSYRHLSEYERDGIESCLRAGVSKSEIARRIGRDRSTISREVARIGNITRKNYDARMAEKLAQSNASMPRKPRKLLNAELSEYVCSLLKKLLSPEQIPGRLKVEYPEDGSMQVSHESIYQYVYVMPKGELRTEVLEYLRQGHKKRRPRARGKDRRGSITNMKTISERPDEIENRNIPRHWEGDLIKGNASSIGMLVKRTTRYTLLVKMRSPDAANALTAFKRAFDRVPLEIRKSMTYDRGKEMARHEELSEKVKFSIYFADPHSPWQRGTNENTNGLTREYFPQGMDLSKVTTKEIRRVEKELNDRPRKVHGFYTAGEMYRSILTGKPVALGS